MSEHVVYFRCCGRPPSYLAPTMIDNFRYRPWGTMSLSTVTFITETLDGLLKKVNRNLLLCRQSLINIMYL